MHSFKLGGGQNGSLTGSGSSGVSLPQQPPILHASSDSVVAASPTSPLIELSGSGAGAVDMWWIQARWVQARCAGRLARASARTSMHARQRGEPGDTVSLNMFQAEREMKNKNPCTKDKSNGVAQAVGTESRLLKDPRFCACARARAVALWCLCRTTYYSTRFAPATAASWLKTASLCARSAAVAFATALSATSVLSAASKSRTCGARRIVRYFRVCSQGAGTAAE